MEREFAKITKELAIKGERVREDDERIREENERICDEDVRIQKEDLTVVLKTAVSDIARNPHQLLL